MGVLASVELSAATATLVLRLDANRQVQQIVATNDNDSDATIQLWIVPRDTIRADKHKWVPSTLLPENEFVLMLEGPITLGPQDQIWAESDLTNVNINVTGI